MTIKSTIPYWTPRPPVADDEALNACLAALGNKRQRTILQVLIEYSRSLTQSELVARLVTVEGKTLGSADELSVEISLTHVDLPQLAAAQLVATSDESSTVRLLEHPLLDDPHIEQLLVLDDAWDDRIRVMAIERHRLICALVAERSDPLPRDQLAAHIYEQESCRVTHQSPEVPTAASSTHSTPDTATIAAIVDALHHVHLPALEAVGLVVYDPEAGTVVSHTPDSETTRQPLNSFRPIGPPHDPVDCPPDGVGVRLVVSPDGHVEDAYAYTAGESAARTISVPTRKPMTHDTQQSETATTDEPIEAIPQQSTTRQREQWLIDCWLRHNAAS